MLGKNRIETIENLSSLERLDVLDLHSNKIKDVQGVSTLSELRVLNLAGNALSTVENLQGLNSLTELNLRRNCIERVHDLEKLPALQRAFLSNNRLSSFDDIACVFQVRYLMELALDGNPVSTANHETYRRRLVFGISTLRHLDLKRVTDEERAEVKRLVKRDEEQIELKRRRDWAENKRKRALAAVKREWALAASGVGDASGEKGGTRTGAEADLEVLMGYSDYQVAGIVTDL